MVEKNKYWHFDCGILRTDIKLKYADIFIFLIMTHNTETISYVRFSVLPRSTGCYGAP